jgi:hypothetical protein
VNNLLVNINLKSGKNMVVDELEYINERSPVTGDAKKITAFRDFYISRGYELTFVGRTTSVAVSSNEIEYIKFDS